MIQISITERTLDLLDEKKLPQIVAMIDLSDDLPKGQAQVMAPKDILIPAGSMIEITVLENREMTVAEHLSIGWPYSGEKVPR